MPNDPHPYCMNACEASTMCGEVEVPEHHLEVETCFFVLIIDPFVCSRARRREEEAICGHRRGKEGKTINIFFLVSFIIFPFSGLSSL